MASKRIRRRRGFGLGDGFGFALDCHAVIFQRLARFANGGNRAAVEAGRMVIEKPMAMVQANWAAAMALPFGAHAAFDAMASTYRNAVRSNRRRLARKN